MKAFLSRVFVIYLFSISHQSFGKIFVKILENKRKLVEKEIDKYNTDVEADEDLNEETEKDNPHPSPVSGPLDSRHGPSRYLAGARNKQL